MDLRLNHDSPVPVYHQLAEALRYRIATGRLRPGQRLPAARVAAQSWQIHFHTVRRAYQELARQGLVTIAGAHGVRVSARGATRPASLERFIHAIRRTAARDFGLSSADLARHLLADGIPHGAAHGGASRTVHVLECSLTQCQDLAAQLGGAFEVAAIPWPLSNPDPVPVGTLVATLFHFNDLRRRCPERLAGIHFVSLRLDPELPMRVASAARRGVVLRACDPDVELRRNLAADLAGVFAGSAPPPRIEPGAARLPRRPVAGQLQVVSPRLWGGLTAAQRGRADVLQARYVFEPNELLDLGARLGWPAVRAQEETA